MGCWDVGVFLISGAACRLTPHARGMLGLLRFNGASSVAWLTPHARGMLGRRERRADVLPALGSLRTPVGCWDGVDRVQPLSHLGSLRTPVGCWDIKDIEKYNEAGMAHSARPWDVGTPVPGGDALCCAGSLRTPVGCWDIAPPRSTLAHDGSLRTPVGCWDHLLTPRDAHLSRLTPDARGMLGLAQYLAAPRHPMACVS